MNGEFYVGYLPRAPRGIAARIRRTAGGLLAGVTAMGLTLTLAQSSFPPATFEYGQTRTFSGVIHEFPAPSLEMENGRTALLAAPGKHGASNMVRGLEGRPADLSGSRIQRDGELMIEIAPGSVKAMGPRAALAARWEPAGEVRLRGEIVDSKCYLGVMNPGEGKVHRDCATRCISGGIPPALIVRDASGQRRFLLLSGPGGRAINREILTYVGEPIVLTGRLFRSGDRLRIEADPRDIRPVE